MEEQAQTVIKVDNVSKVFRLPHEKTGSVKSIFTSAFSMIRKRQTFEVQQALKDVSFEVKKGEFFGIVGRNGSGKSTMLKMLANIYQPTTGELNFTGKLVPFIELGVGFNPELTGRENVYLNGALLGFSEKQVNAIYDEIVEFSELEKFMDQKLKNYSSGMQVRLAFSVATHAEADILLVDEVLAVGDADFQRKCFDYFRKLKRDKITVVFVTHDMNAIREYCDRAILIEKSRLVVEGDPEVVAQHYTRMFMEKTNSEENKKNAGKRWGDGALRYSSVVVTPQTVRTQKTITITAKIKARELIEDPIFGFSIQNSAGQHILGTNNRLKHYKTKNIPKGGEATINWEVPHIFGDGVYNVTVAASRSNGQDCDWWEDAASFTVFKEEKTPYLVTPDVKLVINDD
jgi:ABC-2 type transport system ATP-binding protein